MRKLKLALVGRPNVGKSALFNRLCGRRHSIVDDEEGTTRDRIYSSAEFFGKPFEIIDTGGLSTNFSLPFQESINEQVELALKEADVIIMVVDGQVGITPADEYVSRLLLRQNKPLCLAVNKIDDLQHLDRMYDFYGLGIENIVTVSAVHGYQIAELLELAFKHVSFDYPVSPDQETIKVALIGKPNVGKSTILNFLLKEQRSVVSPIAGTTRDAIDATIIQDGVGITFIDTAGIRRKRAEHCVVDKFASIRTQKTIARADICILVLDAQEGLTTQEKKIASLIEKAGKGCILVFNKWDLVKGFRMEHCLKAIYEDSSFLAHCPALCVSATTGRNLSKIIHHIINVDHYQKTRISTGQLNKFIEKTLQKYPPPMIQGKRLRIYYMTHVETKPPTFVLFINYPELMLETYKKYLIHQFRQTYNFSGNPLFFILKDKRKIEKKHKEALSEEYFGADEEAAEVCSFS